VLSRIRQKVREKFRQERLLYVRNYGHGLDLSWQKAFRTTSKSEVEKYCREAQIEFEWQDEQRLTTKQLCQTIARHPKSGEEVWFNQAHLFHISSLDPAARESLLSTFDQASLPRNVYFGDGSPIDGMILDEIRDAYRRETVTFDWQEGDVLMLDNMLTAHGRLPFVGERKIVVTMAQPFICK
jgi:alpha-ketoglutarate-dependent taurine dioxygenase